MPWAIHLSGKTEATLCIHAGSSLKTKNTPEMNCSTMHDRGHHRRRAVPGRGTRE